MHCAVKALPCYRNLCETIGIQAVAALHVHADEYICSNKLCNQDHVKYTAVAPACSRALASSAQIHHLPSLPARLQE